MNDNTLLKNEKVCSTQNFSKQPVWYGESLAMSLVLFAQNNKKFSEHLRKIINDLHLISIGNIVRIESEIEVLLPQSYYDAMRRTEWLINGISSGSLPGSKNAADILTAWVGDRAIEVPKQLVVGVLAIAIPGVTLGLFPKSKRMMFIIRRGIVAQKELKLAKKVTQLSHGVLISALNLAQDDLRKLEPEISDWFFGDREISFYCASDWKMKKIKRDLLEQGVTFISSEQGDRLDILAISPSVNSFISEIFWDLDKIES